MSEERKTQFGSSPTGWYHPIKSGFCVLSRSEGERRFQGLGAVVQQCHCLLLLSTPTRDVHTHLSESHFSVMGVRLRRETGQTQEETGQTQEGDRWGLSGFVFWEKTLED